MEFLNSKQLTILNIISRVLNVSNFTSQSTTAYIAFQSEVKVNIKKIVTQFVILTTLVGELMTFRLIAAMWAIKDKNKTFFWLLLEKPASK